MKYLLYFLLPLTCNFAYAQIDVSELSPEEVAGYSKVSMYIQDAATIDDYKFNTKHLITELCDSVNCYSFAYHSSGILREVIINNNTTGKEHIYEMDKSGKIKSEYDYEQEVNSNVSYLRQAIFYNDNGRKIQTINYFETGRSKIYLYREDDGSLEEAKNYVNGKLEGKTEMFYRNGKLKTLTFLTKDKIVTLEEFEEDGKKVEATKVENGNGYWLKCDPEGGFCCECYVVNGKLKNCKNLNGKKTLKQKKR